MMKTGEMSNISQHSAIISTSYRTVRHSFCNTIEQKAPILYASINMRLRVSVYWDSVDGSRLRWLCSVSITCTASVISSMFLCHSSVAAPHGPSLGMVSDLCQSLNKAERSEVREAWNWTAADLIRIWGWFIKIMPGRKPSTGAKHSWKVHKTRWAHSCCNI